MPTPNSSAECVNRSTTEGSKLLNSMRYSHQSSKQSVSVPLKIPIRNGFHEDRRRPPHPPQSKRVPLPWNLVCAKCPCGKPDKLMAVDTAPAAFAHTILGPQTRRGGSAPAILKGPPDVKCGDIGLRSNGELQAKLGLTFQAGVESYQNHREAGEPPRRKRHNGWPPVVFLPSAALIANPDWEIEEAILSVAKRGVLNARFEVEFARSSVEACCWAPRPWVPGLGGGSPVPKGQSLHWMFALPETRGKGSLWRRWRLIGPGHGGHYPAPGWTPWPNTLHHPIP